MLFTDHNLLVILISVILGHSKLKSNIKNKVQVLVNNKHYIVKLQWD